jgi:RNA polymerase sigma-32 factor
MSDMINLPALSSEASFAMYLREINKIPSLTKEEEFLLAKAYLENQDLEAAHKLVTSHLKLVAKIAMRYRNYGLPITELVSEGNIGLMQAVKKYDPDLGYRLSTYSMWWIKASIQEYVLKSWSLVKIGTTSAQKKLFFSLSKIKHKITNMYSRAVNEGDYQAIAEELGVTVQEVNEMSQRLSGPDLSLNRTVNNDTDNSGSEMLELLPEAKPSQEDMLSRRQILVNKTQILSEAMSMLNEREVQILTARKLNDSPSTLDTLSTQYNISKERVRQIETKAFEKVQNHVLNRISNDGQIKALAN